MDQLFKSNQLLKTPVLFLIFNRYDTTQQVFEAIKKARPPRLYIASDGAREYKENELTNVQEIRDYVLTNIDWQCEVKTLFRDTNLGCRNAISSAIDWFFGHEEMGIIIEDDCLPSQSFFCYCDNLLKKYENDSRIMCISGNNFFPKLSKNNYSYHFSEIPQIWGWATWKRAWELNNIAINNFVELQANHILISSNSKANKMWWKKAGKTYYKEIDTWDYLWSFTNLINNGLTIIPNNNLVKNIGIGHINSTHTNKIKERFIIETEEMPFPLIHPPYLRPDFMFDKMLYKNILNVNPFWKRVVNELKRRGGV